MKSHRPSTRLPRLIGFTGKASAGKDSAALSLARYGYQQFSFGDLLYQEISQAFGVDPELLRARHLKERPTRRLALRRCRDDDFILALLSADEITTLPQEYDAPRSPRWLMQRWGTEYRRAQDPEYWIRHAKATFAAAQRQQTRMANTSVRFVNEAQWIEAEGGVILHIYRATELRGTHRSEQGLPWVYIDASVENNGTLDDLHDELLRMLAAVSR